MKKNVISIMLASLLLISHIPVRTAFAADKDIRIVVDGVELQTDVAPLVFDDRVLIPFRAIFEALDALVLWNGEKRYAIGIKDDICVELPLNKNEAFVSGSRVILDTAITAVSGRILVPLRFIAEVLGAEVSWDHDSKLVSISTGKLSAKNLIGEKGNVRNKVSGEKLVLGMQVSELFSIMGGPDSVYPDSRRFSWYLYNTDRNDTIHIGVDGEAVVAFSTNSMNWKYTNNVSTGQAVPSFYLSNQDETLNLFFDGFGQGTVSGFSLFAKDVEQRQRVYDVDVTSGMERMLFDYTNTTRAINGAKELYWCEYAAQAARKHSIDMGLRQYFSHSTPEGLLPWERMKAEGINYFSAGENLSYASFYSFDILNIHNRWMNSAGHRNNILNQTFQFLGIGLVNSGDGNKYIYSTQNFYSAR